MGRIVFRRRKSIWVYQLLLYIWLSIRQRIMLDVKNVDDYNLMFEVSVFEYIFFVEDIIFIENNVFFEIVVIVVQEKGIKKLLLKIWYLLDSFVWMELLFYFYCCWVIIVIIVLLLVLLWLVFCDNINSVFLVSVLFIDVLLQV